MDLSFTRPEEDAPATTLPTALAVLMVAVAMRQATSPTAMAQARLGRASPDRNPLAPENGAFNAGVAAAFTGWSEK
ncbi:hypothetical protein [Stakelama saccharophila]|uniref:Uncharacterized protein n=1 Tax=Stakelama saccharophila TaxID=3075605 RepID=A0ABZ0B909_9SPHN|nr:hypothetical protein [Stakelama sp. W311]WNO53879.1 hypothetical protein RPR59_01060 [Stakelama sp. W311]